MGYIPLLRGVLRGLVGVILPGWDNLIIPPFCTPLVATDNKFWTAKTAVSRFFSPYSNIANQSKYRSNTYALD